MSFIDYHPYLFFIVSTLEKIVVNVQNCKVSLYNYILYVIVYSDTDIPVQNPGGGTKRAAAPLQGGLS